jgi:hypothetical protein
VPDEYTTGEYFRCLIRQLQNCVFKLFDKEILREEHASLGSCLESRPT